MCYVAGSCLLLIDIVNLFFGPTGPPTLFGAAGKDRRVKQLSMRQRSV